jgi:hypothetical protein
VSSVADASPPDHDPANSFRTSEGHKMLQYHNIAAPVSNSADSEHPDFSRYIAGGSKKEYSVSELLSPVFG